MNGTRPNILVVMSDQHNKSVLGCYGDPQVRTPNLDRLAAEGLKFTNAYCPAPLCVPSRMSFMTSLTPSRNEVWHNGNVLRSDIPTWADYLNWSDYDTTLIGRMHFAGPDQRHGFNARICGDLNPTWGTVPRVSCGQRGESVKIAGKGVSQYAWYDEYVTEKACEFIKERSKCRNERPFAAVVGFLQPHSPYIANAELFDYYKERLPKPDITEGVLPEQARRHRQLHGYDTGITEEHIRNARAAYYAMCETMDSLVGGILRELDSSPLSENTLVIYCSDHGDMIGEHGCWFKSTYYEGSAGVPLIMRLPGGIQGDESTDAVCGLMDLGPTFTELAGTEMENVDGKSLLPVLTVGSDAHWNNQTFSEMIHDQATPPVASKMIRKDHWKLWTAIYPDGLRTVMFNLKNDPDENNDLSSNPDYAYVRNQLLGQIHSGWNFESNIVHSEERKNNLLKLISAYKDHSWEHGSCEIQAPTNTDHNVILC